jgi:hypothetical protein
MCILSYGKSVVGKKLENRVLITEARVTVIDGLLAVAMLVGMLAQIAFGWWWVDAITSLVIVGYGLWEAVHVLGVRIATLLFVASAATAYGVLFFYTPEKLTPQYRTSRVLESYTAKLTDHDLVIQKSAARIVWSEDKTGYYSRLSDASLLDYAALKYYSDDVALVQFLAPKDCGGVDTFVVDIKKKKVLSEKHHSNIMLFVTQGYFFFGQLGAQELVGSYTYGARDFTVFDDSKLSPGETFSNTISDMCPSLGRFATTSDSLTVEYYKQNDFDYSHKAPLRDNVAGGYYFKKQGEKRFHLAP